MAPRTESWVRDYTRVIARFHGVTYLCVIYVSAYTNKGVSVCKGTALQVYSPWLFRSQQSVSGH